MKKIIEIIKENKIFIILLIGIIVTSISVYAVNNMPNASEVRHDTNEPTNVQNAIDELYERIK